MAAAGIRELIVIAQDTSYYGMDIYGKRMLPKLLQELCKIEGIQWIRLMYVYDNGITDELIQVMRQEEKICNYLDIPIQHVSDSVLKRMRRQSTGQSIRNTVQKLREAIPDIHIRTTILIGFPGETQQDFDELMQFVQDIQIQRLGAFAFSDEEGTPSHQMENKVDEDTKQSRVNTLMECQSHISYQLNREKIGQTFQVIVDEVIPEEVEDETVHRYVGRTRYDSPEIDNAVEFTTSITHVPGDMVYVKVTDGFEYDLYAEEVSNESTK